VYGTTSEQRLAQDCRLNLAFMWISRHALDKTPLDDIRKFGDPLEKTQKKLAEVSSTLENAADKSRTIEKNLKCVQEVPESAGKRLFDAAE